MVLGFTLSSDLFTSYGTTLSEMKLHDLAVGGDGRNRCMLSPFGSKDRGANQPQQHTVSSSDPPVWIRALIKTRSGGGLSPMWTTSNREFGIAAALSGDTRMQEAYLSGDPYLEFCEACRRRPIGCNEEDAQARA